MTTNARNLTAYRIGYGAPYRLAVRWSRVPTPAPWPPTSDRWRRCWQAEWDGCERAVRAWTRFGALRRAVRAGAIDTEERGR